MEKLRFPIGRWHAPKEPDMAQIQLWIKSISELPQALQELIKDLEAHQWSLQYRPDSWTVLQLVHHIVDSHINAYVRQKMAVTGPTPVVVPYMEQKWALLADVNMETLADSMAILKGLHRRWTIFLNALSENEIRTKGYFHQGEGRMILMEEAIGMYYWHGEHHMAHIRLALGM